MKKTILAAWRGATKDIDKADVLAALGIILVAAGLWEWSRSAALVISGSVILWLALPPRPPFIGSNR